MKTPEINFNRVRIACIVFMIAVASTSALAQRGLTQDEAISTALSHLTQYEALCSLRGAGGISLAEDYKALFVLNARVPNDISGDGAMSIQEYISFHTKYFKQQDLRVELLVRRDLVRANFDQTNKMYVVTVPFQKTMSHKVVSGKLITERTTYWMRGTINVPLDPDKQPKIYKIELDQPDNPSEFSAGLFGAYGFSSGAFQSGMLETSLDPSQLTATGGLRFRFVFNPLSPTNFIQRKNIRFYVGAEATYTLINASIDEIGQQEVVRPDLFPGNADVNVAGSSFITATNVSERWTVFGAAFNAGLNFDIEPLRRNGNKGFVNIGVTYELPLSVSYALDAECQEHYVFDTNQDIFRPDVNGIDYGIFVPQYSSSPMHIDPVCQTANGETLTREGEEEVDPRLYIDLNPTYQKKIGRSESLVEFGLLVRVPLSGWSGRGKGIEGALDEFSGSALLEYSDELNHTWLGVNVSYVF